MTATWESGWIDVRRRIGVTTSTSPQGRSSGFEDSLSPHVAPAPGVAGVAQRRTAASKPLAKLAPVHLQLFTGRRLRRTIGSRYRL